MAASDANCQVTAVVVTYQSAQTVRETLAALRESHDIGLARSVVVDNASRDETPALLQREAGWAKVVLEQVNHGFGRGCNVGFAHVETPYTLFVNPDAVVGPDAIRAMLAFMAANPKVGVVGPATTVGEKASLVYQHTGPRPRPLDVLRRQTSLLGRPAEQHAIVPGSSPFKTGWVCGAVMMVRTDVLRQLGGFDSRFFLYWEEMDLCRRVENSGFEIWAVGDAVAHHTCGASTGGDGLRIDGCIPLHFYQSRRHYLIKHHGWLIATLTEVAELGLMGLLVGLDVLRGRGTSRIRPRLQARLFSRPAPVPRGDVCREPASRSQASQPS